MTRHAALFVTVGFLLISGCATTPAHRSTPVALTITIKSDTAGKGVVDLQWFRNTTLALIAEQVPNARNPMTMNVKLDVTSREQWISRIVSSGPWTPMPISSEPSFSFENTTSEQITRYRVVYTISDAAGQLIESNQLTLDNGQLVDAKTGAPLKARFGLFGDTAMFLASRVKTIEQ
ncbi:MAG TPA: hypothetical protein VGQ65_02745 [Thermoanaerobaculia bacterium]|jgi:hypothetical protein|nr:hypothetical protein [Thermoanaerobaculia bacterium]